MRKLWALLLSAALASGAVATVAGPAEAAPNDKTITLLATTDVHGNVFNWDYFQNKTYSDKVGNVIGLASAGAVINKVRAESPANTVVVVDNGDSLQGTPLDYYFAKQEPVVSTGAIHPMAAAYNAIGYDANNIGNHEFNYGLDLLAKFRADLTSPLLAANVIDVKTGGPMFTPYTLVKRTFDDAKPITIGILGVTTPGSMIWDAGNLAGRVRIDDMLSTVKAWVPRVHAAGADIVVVLVHGGDGAASSYDTTNLGPENGAKDIAAQVPGIDAMVLGHSHQDIASELVTNTATGKTVVLTQPKQWAMGVADVQFKMTKVRGQWTIAGTVATEIYSRTAAAPDPAVVQAVQADHLKAVAYVNKVIATSTTALPATESRYKDTAIIDYIQMVQTQTVAKALAGGSYANLPLLSIAAPFSRTAIFPKGDVTVRDMAGLYIYDNTLEARLLTGLQIRAYLEYSAKYFATVPGGGTFNPETDTQVVYNGLTVWDYNYDIMSGVDYTIDLSLPVGSRITSLTYQGAAVSDTAQFVVAINNYRSSGGGNFPGTGKQSQVIYDQKLEIRQLLIDWAQAKGVIDPADFFVQNWSLKVAGVPAV